jgi:hypothetical protein
VGTDKSVPFQNSGINRVFPQPVKPRTHFGLNRHEQTRALKRNNTVICRWLAFVESHPSSKKRSMDAAPSFIHRGPETPVAD